MTDRELLTLRTRALDRVVGELDQVRKVQRNTVASQFWRFDVAVRHADYNARQEGRKYTVRRHGTTNTGQPVWEIRPADPQTGARPVLTDARPAGN